MKSPLLQKQVFSWALYDWANSAFATTVMVVFFPLFNKQYLSADQAATTSTATLAFVSSASSFVLAVMAPWLGVMADRGNAHLKFLMVFTAIGVVPTAALAFVSPGDWATGGVLFALASIGFWGGLIFYDSMLVHVAPRGRLDSVSGFGYALGYLGGGLLLLINILMYAKPQLFGWQARKRESAHRSSRWRCGGRCLRSRSFARSSCGPTRRASGLSSRGAKVLPS